MTDKPRLADARRVAERFTPDSTPWWKKPAAFKVDTEPISAAVVPAMEQALRDVLALHVVTSCCPNPHHDVEGTICPECFAMCEHDIQDWPCPTARAIAAHLDIEEQR